MNRIVAYYRVSTQKQGRSGLGLEAQESCIKQFCRENNAEMVKAFREVESGKSPDRPELTKAIAFARRAGAKLVVAKLDRLARSVTLISKLLDTKIDFVACDCPHANTFTIHILAALAEHERKLISERTKAALAAYKARGGQLGTDNLTKAGQAKGAKLGAEANRRKALEAYADLLPTVRQLRNSGATLQGIADELNAEGHTTVRGRSWTHVQVKFLLDRAARAGV